MENSAGAGKDDDNKEDDNDNDDNDNDNNNDEKENDGEERQKVAIVDGTTATIPEDMLLFFDAANGFNKLSRYSMLWTVWQKCPWLAKLTFNSYRNQVRLIWRQPEGKLEIILSQEEFMQGDPLTMVLYGIALLLLANILQERFPDVLQTCYADNAAMQGPPDQVGSACFKNL